MSQNLLNLFTHQYSQNVALLLQEAGFKLRPYVGVGQYVGDQASPVNQIGSVSMRPVADRFAPKVHTHATNARRWVFPSDFTLDQPVDKFDTLKTIVDVKSPYATNAQMAAGRQMDDTIIAAADGTAYIGINGGSTESFDTNDSSTSAGARVDAAIGAAADTGLNVPKLIECKRRFRAAFVDVDAEPMVFVAGSRQEANLLNQTQVVSTDFNARPVLVDGRVVSFMGFGFVWSERLAKPSNDRLCLAWVKSGMHLGIWDEVESDAHQRFDLEANPWELSTTMSVGATRLEQYRVLRVECTE